MQSRKHFACALVLLLGSFVLAGSAEADKTVKLTTGAALRARPGERAPTITKLASGQMVRIVAEKGRWLQVSVGGRVGWITRTQAELDEETEVVSKGKGKKGERAPGGKRDKSKAWDQLEEGAVGGDVVAATDEEEEKVERKADAEEEEEEEAPRAKKLTKKEKRELAKQEKLEREREAREAREQARREKEEAEAQAAAAAAEPKFEEGQTIVVKRATSVRKKPSAKSAELYEAAKGDKGTVLLVDEEGAWVRIEDEEGTKGWVAAADLGGSAPVAVAKKKAEPKPVEVAEAEAEEEEEEAPLPKKPAKKAKVVEEEEDDEDAKEIAGKDDDSNVPGADKPRRFTWFISAGGGFLSRTQRFTSGGAGVRANYGINNSAPAIQAGGQAIMRFGHIGIGAEAWYLRSIGGSGIAISDDTNMGTLDYRTVAIDARLLAGYELAGIFFHGRAGYHRDSTYVTFDDFAMLPDERVGGLTVGAGIAAPRLTSRLGLHAEIDMLLAGKLTQDAGARDGTETKSVAYYISGGASYKVLKGLEASASYALTMAGYGFAGPSDRDSDAIDGRRKDRQHLVTVGAKYSF
jgi:uncharacterized protein YgiM (DUF1202 family)